MTKAGLAWLIKEKMKCASSEEILFFLYISHKILLPTGKPQRKPRTIIYEPL